MKRGVPPVMIDYMEGLRTHDVERIAGTVADHLAFVTSKRTLTKAEFLDMLRAIYRGFPDWTYDHDEPVWEEETLTVLWRQGGRHLGEFTWPGMPPVPATGREVRIPPHRFFYRFSPDHIVEIRPEPVPGGAPRGIFEQIGVEMPPV